MRITIIASMLITTVMFAGCDKDDPDPCEAVQCHNAGTCVDGVCDCPDGYGGADCSNPIAPDAIRITKVRISNFPSTNDGEPWDGLPGYADLTFSIYKGSTLVYESPLRYDNANTETTYDFVPNTPLILEHPEEEYQFNVYDYDGPDTKEFMIGLAFVPWNPHLQSVIRRDFEITDLEFSIFTEFHY